MRTRRYRSKLRIIADILQTIRDEGGLTGPTKILYGANLSYDRLMKYLDELKALGLVSEDRGEDDRVLYRITSKGISFLVEFKKIKEFAEAFGVNI